MLVRGQSRGWGGMRCSSWWVGCGFARVSFVRCSWWVGFWDRASVLCVRGLCTVGLAASNPGTVRGVWSGRSGLHAHARPLPFGTRTHWLHAVQVTLLSACGLRLRGADPAAMKDFVVAVHARAADATQKGVRG